MKNVYHDNAVTINYLLYRGVMSLSYFTVLVNCLVLQKYMPGSPMIFLQSPNVKDCNCQMCWLRYIPLLPISSFSSLN